MLKIQSDGKGYGKPVNPHYLFENQTEEDEENSHEAVSNLRHRKFDEAHPTLPLYLPNNDPYLGDDVVEGEPAHRWYDYNDGYQEWDFVNGDDEADEIEQVRRLKNNGYTVVACYRVLPVVKEQAERMTIDDHLNRIKQIQFELAEDVREQARINIATMYRQCGMGYDENGNPIFDKGLLQEWFEKWHNKKDYNLYDTI